MDINILHVINCCNYSLSPSSRQVGERTLDLLKNLWKPLHSFQVFIDSSHSLNDSFKRSLMDFSLFAPAPLTLFYEVGRVKFINLKKHRVQMVKNGLSGTDGSGESRVLDSWCVMASETEHYCYSNWNYNLLSNV